MKEGINKLQNELGSSRILTQSRAWQARYCHLDDLRWMKPLREVSARCLSEWCLMKKKKDGGGGKSRTHLKWCASFPKISSSHCRQCRACQRKRLSLMFLCFVRHSSGVLQVPQRDPAHVWWPEQQQIALERAGWGLQRKDESHRGREEETGRRGGQKM